MAESRIDPAVDPETPGEGAAPDPGGAERETWLLERWFDDPRVEYAVLAVLSALVSVFSLSLVRASVDLYFPADAGEYATDADALWGHGVREIRHPLLFPALLSVFQPFVGDIGAFQIGIGVALFLLPASLYLLLRQYLPPLPSLAGAAMGSMTPPVGELLGWGGASTLLAIDFMVLSVAVLETWIRRGGKRGLLLGATLGLVSLSHPFVFTATLFVVFVRWAWHAARHRSFGGDWGPLGWRGIVSTAAVTLALFSLSAPYYFVLASPGQGTLFDVGLLVTILLWAVRESVFLLFFLLLAILLPLARGKVDLFVVVATVGALVVGIPLAVSWDSSYSSRVAYFLPILFGAGTALLGDLVLEEVNGSRPLRRLGPVIVVGILLAAAVGAPYGLGYVERVGVASAYYQRIHADDLPAFDFLRAGSGTVAVSWPGSLQGEGVVNSWLVEGLSDRPALGPGAPWLSTVPSEAAANMDLQRFFAGAVGVENGAVQATASRTGGLADPALAVNVSGFYYPLAYVNSFANTYPVPVAEGVNASVIGDALVAHHPQVNGTAEVLETTRLDADTVTVTYSLVGGNASTAIWDIWIWPAYYRPWDDVVSEGPGFRMSTAYRDGSIASHVQPVTPGTVALYFPADPRWGLQAMELRGNGTDSVSFQVRADSREPAGALLTFDEGRLLAQYGITDVLLWKDSGWQPRFNVSPRYERVFETPNLLVYRVV